MTATAATVAAPPWAITIWCDLTHIYIQLPSTHGPCVIDYPRDAYGLGQVLTLMRDRHVREGAASYQVPVNPLHRPALMLSPNSRDVVRDLLRRKGIGPR